MRWANASCVLNRWQYIKWRHGRHLEVRRQVENFSDAYLLEEHPCQISSRSDLSRRRLRLLWSDRPNKKNKIITPSQHKKSHKIIKSHHISCIAAVSSIHFLSWVFRACLLLLAFISLQVFRCKAIDLSVLMIAGGKPNVYERHESMLAVVSMRVCGH